MITTALIAAGLLVGVGIMSILHMPRWLARIIMWPKAWIQAIVVHFIYGGWLGTGVTAHMVGGFMSIPWFFLAHYWLRPMILGKATSVSKLFPRAVPNLATAAA